MEGVTCPITKQKIKVLTLSEILMIEFESRKPLNEIQSEFGIPDYLKETLFFSQLFIKS